VEHIALSTNGSAEIKFYQDLLNAGVNDFSISLDACCSKTAEAMSGGLAVFDHIIEVIKYLSQRTYVTVGIVLDDQNNAELEKIIQYATELGVSDIRIIPSAQSDHQLKVDVETNLPILKYRLNNINSGRHVRGIQEHDCSKCYLVLDDMAVLNMKHYPCIIYMREQGEAIGKVSEWMRADRLRWFKRHNSLQDPICKKNCLDVCIDHNNKVQEFFDLERF
jgi:MoaA/NifB/PqqE/SkfB family radical SAM enzyme